MKQNYTEEELFCLKVLYENGRLPEAYIDPAKDALKDFHTEFKFVRVQNDFFTELAEKMRLLWPTGEKKVVNKDGTISYYPWRDSVKNLVKRLTALWEVRALKDYTLEECLTVARRYLAQFENNAKYMKTLKYFILRQNENVIGDKGKIHYINNSTFADMLEGNSVDAEWEAILDENNMYEVR